LHAEKQVTTELYQDIDEQLHIELSDNENHLVAEEETIIELPNPYELSNECNDVHDTEPPSEAFVPPLVVSHMNEIASKVNVHY